MRASTQRDWTGDGFTVTATPGQDLHLSDADGQVIAVDDQDVPLLCAALLECADQGGMSSFESCMLTGRPDQWHDMVVSAEDGWLRIEPSYSRKMVRVSRVQAHALAVALLDAHDHAVAGPCPHCGRSVADDHPANGC